MKTDIRAIITEALELKEASTKRAMNTKSNPAFKPIYENELRLVNQAREFIALQDDK